MNHNKAGGEAEEEEEDFERHGGIEPRFRDGGRVKSIVDVVHRWNRPQSPHVIHDRSAVERHNMGVLL